MEDQDEILRLCDRQGKGGAELVSLEGRARGGGRLQFVHDRPPPAAAPQANTAAQAADLILIPCRPSLVDVDAIRRTAQLVKSAGVPAFVVLNAAPHSSTALLDDARAIVEGSGLTTAPIVLRERGVYRAAWPVGQSVNEAEPGCKAAREIAALKDWVFAQLQVCTPAQEEKGKVDSYR